MYLYEKNPFSQIYESRPSYMTFAHFFPFYWTCVCTANYIVTACLYTRFLISLNSTDYCLRWCQPRMRGVKLAECSTAATPTAAATASTAAASTARTPWGGGARSAPALRARWGSPWSEPSARDSGQNLAIGAWEMGGMAEISWETKLGFENWWGNKRMMKRAFWNKCQNLTIGAWEMSGMSENS